MSVRRSLLFLGVVCAGSFSVAALRVLPGFNDEGRAISPVQRPYTDAEILQVIQDILPGDVGQDAIEARITSQSPHRGRAMERNAIDCWIRNHDGNAVSQVEEARLGDKSYWMSYLSNGANADFVWFVTQPLHGGCAIERQMQMFRPVSDTNIETPLGIPHWGHDNTCGDWVMVVYNDLGDFDVFFFEVVPR